jgi:hypothetical protein
MAFSRQIVSDVRHRSLCPNPLQGPDTLFLRGIPQIVRRADAERVIQRLHLARTSGENKGTVGGVSRRKVFTLA